MLPVPAPDDMRRELSVLLEKHADDIWKGYTIQLKEWLGDDAAEEAKAEVTAEPAEQRVMFSA